MSGLYYFSIEMPKRNDEQKIRHNQARKNFTKQRKRAIFCLNHIKNSYPDIVKEANDTYDYLFRIYPNKRDMMKTDVYKGMMTIKAASINHTPNETDISYPQPTTSNPMPNQSDGFHPQPAVNHYLQPTTQEQKIDNIEPQLKIPKKQKINNMEPQLQIPLLNFPLDVKDIIPQTHVISQEYTTEIINQSTDSLPQTHVISQEYTTEIINQSTDSLPQTPAISQEYTDDELIIKQTTDLLTELQQDPYLKSLFIDQPASNITVPSEEIAPMSLTQEIDQIIQEEFDLFDCQLPDIDLEEMDELSRLACM